MKTTREIAIADHLWAALERMATEMGADREALVNQALHAFARWNGYVVPGAPDVEAAPLPPPPALGTVSPKTLPPPLAPALRRGGEAAQVLEVAARLERAIGDPTPRPGATPAPGGAPAASLTILREDGTTCPVAKERFVIGRGRHCDLVIDSAKVSREHAAIVREEGAWAIEDLGSSNGTWHQRERVARRRIADGDEYYVCSEKLRCVLR